jgi:hypothetical protein
MKKLDSRTLEARVEAVTTTFVASGQPEGIHDMGRFLENLNNPSVFRHIELRDPAVRPLYRASSQLHLDAPLLIRREDIVFATVEGPYLTRGAVRPEQVDAPVLLMAPPFQIQGTVALAPGAAPTQALRSLVQGFFVVRRATVFDADGNALGEGDYIIVNGAVVQMATASRRHISAGAPPAAQRRADSADEAPPAGETSESEERPARAA